MITIEELYQIFKKYPSIATDTRRIKKGDIFFALKGQNFNGNMFARKALEAGAAYAIIDEPEYFIDERTLLTNDVLEALQQLSKYHREQFNIPFIAITGSNGKTTTKELINAVLSTTYKTYATEGNLNNHIGIPLTLLSIKPDAEIAIIEMGANHQKEIESYCKYALPTHGLITNCGKAHLEGFGGVEGVKKGKGELFDFLRTTHGIAFACDDFDYFHTMVNGIQEIHWYGTQNGEVVAHAVQEDTFLEVELTAGVDLKKLKTKLVGSYNIYNVLAALSIGKYFNVSRDKMKLAIEGYIPSNSRSQMVEKDGNHIILDAYNANPSSMKEAIENFSRIKADNKILFIGAMMELGSEAEREHKAIVELINQYKWKDVILVGEEFKKFTSSFKYFNNAEDAAKWWKNNQTEDNYLLIKGSRSMAMEKIV